MTWMADKLLDQLRDRVHWGVAALYLFYYALWFLLARPEVGTLMESPRTWLAGIALLVLAGVLLPAESWLRSRPAMISLTALTVFCVVMFSRDTLLLGQQQSLSESLLWLNVLLLLLFLTLGAVNGAVAAGVTLLLIVSLAVIGPHLTQQNRLIWLTGLLTASLLSLVGFLVMNFIERNLILHEQANDQLAAARKDALTGVLGRAATEEELRRCTRHANKTGTPLSIIVTDIDHFKRVNDQFGHGAGDDVLRSFAKRLRRNVDGSGGLVGRWGGEEFIILLPGMARPEALAMGERLRREVSGNPIAGHAISASFGVASYRSAGDDVDSLFGRADERLYEAKNAGRNAVRG